MRTDKTENRTFGRRPRVAIAHPRLAFGGSEKRVFWGLEALKPDFDLTVVTAGRFDLDTMNGFYGTNLGLGDFVVRQIPLPFWLKRTDKAAALQGVYYQRFCRRVAPEYDVMISAYGPIDFGLPAIHFIADFSWCPEIRRQLHPAPSGFLRSRSSLQKPYLWLVERLHKHSGRNLFGGEDWIVAVSEWVAAIMSRIYGVPSRVIHSPVPGNYPDVPFLQREQGFVSLGRTAPEKRIEDILEILTKVRERGHWVHYHAIGPIGNDAYGKKIRKLIARNSDWAVSEGLLAGREKIAVLTGHRYGIHACRGDAFPNSVVEMAKSGCIPFATAEGGQADIVGHEALLYRNQEEAVEKILRVLSDPRIQVDLHDHVLRRSQRYSAEKFVFEFRGLVEEFLEASSAREGRAG